MLQLDDPLFDPVVTKYHDDLKVLSERALSGELTERQYREEVQRLTIAVILAIYLLGGGDPDSRDGRRFVTEQNSIARDSSRALATDLFDGRYSETPKRTAVQGITSLLSRLALWTFTLGYIYNKSRINAPIPPGVEEPREEWVWGDTVEHCGSCGPLNGAVLTVSEWARLGLDPQSPDLDCGGYRCQCKRRPTDEASMGLAAVARMLGV